MKKSYIKSIEVITDDLAKRRKAANTLTEEAKAEADVVIAAMQEAVDNLTAMVDEFDKEDDDKGEDLAAKIDEALAEIAELRKKTETPVPAENKRNAVANSAAYAWDFLNMVKNSATAADFRSNLNGLMVKNGITPDNATLPGSMVKAITDGFSGKHRLLELVDWTGLPMFRALYETNNDIGRVHTKGTKKTDQALVFDPIDIRPDIIYKYLSVDKVMLKQCDTPEQANVLLQYITKELLDRVLFTVETSILTGTAPFIAPASVDVATAADDIIQKVYLMLEKMDNYTNPVLVCNKANYFKLKKSLTDSALITGVMPSDEVAASFLGCREIIPVNTTGGSGLWLVQPEDYKLVGDLRPDQYNSFNLEYNKEQYLTEIYIGGGSINPNNFVTAAV